MQLKCKRLDNLTESLYIHTIYQCESNLKKYKTQWDIFTKSHFKSKSNIKWNVMYLFLSGLDTLKAKIVYACTILQ